MGSLKKEITKYAAHIKQKFLRNANHDGWQMISTLVHELWQHGCICETKISQSRRLDSRIPKFTKKFSIKVMPRNQFPQEIDMKYGFSLKGIWKLMRQCPDWQLWNSDCFILFKEGCEFVFSPKKWFLAWPFCFYPIWAGPLEPAVSPGCPQRGAEVRVQLRSPLPSLPGHSEQRQAGVQVWPPTQSFS